ncbi:MAG: DUF4203 domain-containing protein [Anaerolineae bacterium]|nr:DUF4203 domain-containing protein [Anaerolineae bacterium]
MLTGLPPLGLLLLGAIYCFAGWPLYRVLIAVTGFLVGYSLASPYAAAVFQRPLVALLAAAVVGLLVGWLAVRFITGLAFLYGFVLGGYGAWVYLGRLDWQPLLVLVLALIVGSLVGLLAANLLRLGIIVGTAFVGASLLLDGARAFQFSPPPGLHLLVLLGLTALGALAQSQTGGER